MRTWQRSAIACTRRPDASSIRSRAVSSGVAAYGVGRDVEDPEPPVPGHQGRARRGLLRVSTIAKNSSSAARASWPPSKPRQVLRIRPTSS